MSLIERNVVQSRLLLRDDGLHAYRIVFIDVEIVDVNLPVNGHSGEDCAGVGRPRHIPHLGIEVKHEQRLAENVSLVITLQYDINDHLQSLSQILMIHSEAQVMKMFGMKVFHCMLYTGVLCAV